MPHRNTTLHAALLALVAGSLASVADAQDKEPKDPKSDPKASPRDVRPASPRTPTANQPRNTPKDATTKAALTPAPAAAQPKAAPAQPVPATPAASGEVAPPADHLPPALATDFPPPPPGWFRFDAFAEPVDVKLLVDMVADRLKIQIISTDTALRDKKIQLYTPVDVPEDKLVDFLGLLLEQNGQYIRKDPLGFYVIEVQGTSSNNTPLPNNDLATTQVITTRRLKPSGLALAITQVLKGASAAAGGAAQQQLQLPTNIAYLDDLGVLVITDTPRRIAAVKGLIETLSDEQINLAFTRFDVRHLSAVTAKQRMLELLGQAATRTGLSGFNAAGDQFQQQQQQPNNSMLASMGITSSNLANRLIPDPQANALTLRGRPEEVELIGRLLAVVDVPNQLSPKWYAVGPAAQALAEQGRRTGLGEVIVMQSTRGAGNTQNPNAPGGSFFPDENGFPNFNNRFGTNTQTTNGPVFVLDADQRGFIYYGTAEQHAQIDRLVTEFGEITQAERVVYEFYKLKFVDATKTAELIRGMINNSVPGGESPLIPGAGGGVGARRGSVGAQQVAASNAGTGSGEAEIVATDQVHILPDTNNNQVVVKAPQRLQAQFARLINKIDLRRPQVYIDAKIIVVTNREDFQFAVETQLLGSNGAHGALRTLFPGSPTVPGNILTPPVVGATQGVVAAVIRSDSVPVIINALAQSRSGRIVASPQLLVDDNEEATITSINQEPTTTTTLTGTAGNTTPTTTFDHYEEAGPKLTVKPRLSTGDLLSMQYEVELSSFTGAGSGGIPPPKIVNNIKSDSVTLPSDSTIVVGGLEFSQKSSTVFKVPFLGDIPIIGEAFKSTTNLDDRRTVYVFITPRIMRDPVGNDLRFITRSPAQSAGTDDALPPVRVELIQVGSATHGPVSLPITPPPASGVLGENNPIRKPAEPGPLPGEPAAPPSTPSDPASPSAPPPAAPEPKH
ncbi:MAG TPA: secretin N-terminal domain-containing protein [Phycisphaerales bacterium]|nr:secretin N-terminal domain-containing protein [Phycisphaerales bacterium]